MKLKATENLLTEVHIETPGDGCWEGYLHWRKVDELDSTALATAAAVMSVLVLVMSVLVLVLVMSILVLVLTIVRSVLILVVSI